MDRAMTFDGLNEEMTEQSNSDMRFGYLLGYRAAVLTMELLMSRDDKRTANEFFSFSTWMKSYTEHCVAPYVTIREQSLPTYMEWRESLEAGTQAFMNMPYTDWIRRENDGYFYAGVIEIPAIKVQQQDTIEDAVKRLQFEKHLYFQTQLMEGKRIPEVRRPDNGDHGN